MVSPTRGAGARLRARPPRRAAAGRAGTSASRRAVLQGPARPDGIHGQAHRICAMEALHFRLHDGRPLARGTGSPRPDDCVRRPAGPAMAYAAANDRRSPGPFPGWHLLSILARLSGMLSHLRGMQQWTCGCHPNPMSCLAPCLGLTLAATGVMKREGKGSTGDGESIAPAIHSFIDPFRKCLTRRSQRSAEQWARG